MFEETRWVEAEDLRLYNGLLHLVTDACAKSGCRPVTVAPAEPPAPVKIDEPGVAAVVKDADGIYLHTGSRFAKHWRVLGEPERLREWGQLADDVEQIRPGL